MKRQVSAGSQVNRLVRPVYTSGRFTPRGISPTARVKEVQQELQDAVKKCESLERDIAGQETELAKARQSAQEARVEA